MAERIDNTGFGNIKVIQLEGLGYGVDAVLLAAFAAGETGAKAMKSDAMVADLGSGSGIVGFILCHKMPGVKVVGYDKREGSIDRAGRAAELSDLSDRISFKSADIKGLSQSGYDAVVTNPPYFKQDAAIPSATDDKFIARHETTANISDWMRTSSNMLGKGGDLYMVHRPDRLADIFTAMRSASIEPKELQFVVPKDGESANIVLIHGIKNAGAELKLLPEIAVHTEDGAYTELIMRIYERN